MVAEPTRPSTWIVPSASKLSLSYADLIIRPFLGSSLSWSNEGMVTGCLWSAADSRCGSCRGSQRAPADVETGYDDGRDINKDCGNEHHLQDFIVARHEQIQ